MLFIWCEGGGVVWDWVFSGIPCSGDLVRGVGMGIGSLYVYILFDMDTM